MPSNSPPPRAHKSRTSDVAADSPQRLPQLTSGGSSSAAHTPQKPPSSTGTGSLGPSTQPPTHRPSSVHPPLQPPPPQTQPTRTQILSPTRPLQPPTAVSSGGGQARETTDTPRTAPSKSAAAGQTSTTASSGILPAWARLDLAVFTRPLFAMPTTALPPPTATAHGREAHGGPFSTDPFPAGPLTDGGGVGRERAAPVDVRHRQNAPPPPLMRVGSTATIHSSVLGLRPLIEWVPVPGWDDTEMCRDGKGGFFKADAATGKTYRVEGPPPRDLSRPPTVSSSGAATPVTSSPLPVGGVLTTLTEPEGVPGVYYVRENDLPPYPHPHQQQQQQQQQQVALEEEEAEEAQKWKMEKRAGTAGALAAAAPPTTTASASRAHRHLHFETPSPNTIASTPQRSRAARLSATATTAASPVTVHDTRAAVGDEWASSGRSGGAADDLCVLDATMAESDGGEAASSSQEEEQEQEKRSRVQREAREQSAPARLDHPIPRPAVHRTTAAIAAAAPHAETVLSHARSAPSALPPRPSDIKSPPLITPTESPEPTHPIHLLHDNNGDYSAAEAAGQTAAGSAAMDPDNAGPSSSYGFQWLSSTNWTSGTSGSDDHVAAPLCIPPDVMLRRSLPVASEGYDMHGCSVFTGIRKDGTVAVVVLEPYPERYALSPRSTHTSPLLQAQDQHQLTYMPALSSPPRSYRRRPRKEQTWPCPSPPHSPVQTAQVHAEAAPPLSAAVVGPPSQPYRPAANVEPTVCPRTEPPEAAMPSALPPPTTTAAATNATVTTPGPVGGPTTTIAGLLSRQYSTSPAGPQHVPLARPPLQPSTTTTAAAAKTAAGLPPPPGRPRARSVNASAVGPAAPPPPLMQQQQQHPQRWSLEVDRDASSLHTGIAAVSTMAVHGHSGSVTAHLGAQAVLPAGIGTTLQQPPQLTVLPQQVWSPLMLSAAPPLSAVPVPTSLVASAQVQSRNSSGPPPPPPPPPLQTFAAPHDFTNNNSNNIAAPNAASQGPPEPAAATLKPPPPSLSQTTRLSTVTNSEVLAFVEAAARARGGVSAISSAPAPAPTREVMQAPAPPQQQPQQPQQPQHPPSTPPQQRHALSSPTATTKTSHTQSSPLSSKRPKLSSSHRPPATADVQPPLPPPPHLTVAALSLAEEAPTVLQPSPLKNTTKATPHSLLPSWCLHLVDTLLTPMTTTTTAPGQLPSPQNGQQQQQQQQRAPSAPTPTSGTTTAATTAGSDVDSKMWSVETRNGVPIGWTLKSVTAAERAAAAAAAAAAANKSEADAAVVAARTDEEAGAGRDARQRPHGASSASGVMQPSTSSSSGNRGELNALSLPLPFSLATPEAATAAQLDAPFLHAVRGPAVDTGGAAVSATATAENTMQRSQENAANVELRAEGTEAATVAAAAPEKARADAPPSAPRPAERTTLTGPTPVPPAQQRRYTRTSIMTHSGLNVQTSVNDVGTPIATAAPGSVLPSRAGTTAGTRAGGDGAFTHVLRSAPVHHTAVAMDFDDPDRPYPPQLQATPGDRSTAATAATVTTSATSPDHRPQHRSTAHVRTRSTDLSEDLTLSQFQQFHQQQQQRRQRTAVRVAGSLPVTAAMMLRATIATPPASPPPAHGESADVSAGAGRVAYNVEDTTTTGQRTPAPSLPPPPSLPPVYILHDSKDSAEEWTNIALAGQPTAASTTNNNSNNAGAVQGAGGGAQPPPSVPPPSEALAASPSARHESGLEAEKQQRRGQPGGHVSPTPSLPSSVPRVSSVGGAYVPQRPPSTQYSSPHGRHGGHAQ